MTPIAGLYNVTIFANNTRGASVVAADNFTAAGMIFFNCSVATYNGTGTSAKIEFYYPGTSSKISEFSADNGSFLNQQLLEQAYDMLFKTYGNSLQVTLKGVNISLNLDRTMGFDRPPVQNYTITYAVNTTYSFPSASVRIYYSGINEDHIGAYKCGSWDFHARVCTGTWNSVSYSQDKSQNYVSVDVNSFSAFALKQEPFCGDGTCQPGENQSDCPIDCVCADGEKMSCGTNTGECEKGNITCYNGTWGSECEGGIAPLAEACNGLDDDCDGSTDESLTRQCGNETGACLFGTQTCSNGVWGGCTGGILAVQETCNGLDDDCDGQIDEDSNCCTAGQRECGSATNTGECRKGTSACGANGLWGECTGETGPQAEVCNDGKDNDCDGLTDSADVIDCAGSTCSNRVMDGNETGIDCGGYCTPCADYSLVWIAVSVIGAVVFGFLLFMYFHFRKHGKELTWEELMKKWTPDKGYHYKGG
jgi:hypothetical protein